MKTKSKMVLRVLSVIVVAVLAVARSTKADQPTTAPCMAAIDRFTQPDVPEMSPDETASPAGKWANGVTPADLPGDGLAQHPMLYLGEGYDKMFVVNQGKVIWTYSTGTSYEYDDAWMLSNGNILFSRMQYLAEITPAKKVVWRFDCHNEAGPAHTEIHCCQPIGQDKVLFILNGIPPKLMVVNIKTGAVEAEHELPSKSTNPNSVHGQYRRVRYTAAGTYLVAAFNMNFVIEYDKDFKEIWRYDIKSPWAAIRLKNGNTLISDEADNLTVEVNPKKEIVWEFKGTDLPEAHRFASASQTCTRLANGNTILTSRGDNGKGPQLVEVSPDKKVVWILQDWKTLGPATCVQVLDDPGIPENPGDSEH